MSSEVYFVTGATGFIGSQLCTALRDQSVTVLGQTRKKQFPWLEKKGVEIVSCDLLDPHSYSEALSRATHVVHLAGNPAFGDGKHYYTENTEPLKVLVNTLEAYGSKQARFVYVSTIGAVDRTPEDLAERPLNEDSTPYPTSDYGKSKLAGEEIVKNSKLHWTIIRPSLVVGPSMRFDSHLSTFSQMANSFHPLALFSLSGSFSMIHVEDLCRAIISASLEKKAEKQVFFAAGEPFSLGEIFKQANPNRLRIPLSFFPKRFIPYIPFRWKSLFTKALVAEDCKLRSLTGWEPKHKKSDILQSTINREIARKDGTRAPAGYTLITGAASGLGKSFAEQLHALNRELILVDKDENGLFQEVLPGKNCLRIVCDLSCEEQLEKLLKAPFWDDDKGVCEWISCAGFGLRGLTWELCRKEQENVFRVNVLSRFTMLHQVLNRMRQRYFGRVVLVSSSSAFQPLPYMSCYAASNAALLSLGEGIAAELSKKDGIEIITVCPGGMKTNFQKNSGVKQLEREKLLDPNEMARTVISQFGKGSQTIIYPFRSKAMAFLARIFPRRMTLHLWKKLMGSLR